MKKRPASQSAFFTPRVLIGLAFCSIGLLLTLLVFALYPGGNALAQGPQQDESSMPLGPEPFGPELVAEGPGLEQRDETALEIPEVPGTLGTKEIITSQGFGSEIQPNDTFGAETPFVSSCVVTVLPNNGGLSGNERAPHTGFRYGRSIYLITAAELAANLYPSGAIPTTIGWNYQTAPGVAGAAPLIVYLQNTTDTTNNKSGTWLTAILGMTTVHNATTTLPSTAGPFDITFTGGSPFTYTGDGLYVAFDWGQYTGTLSTTAGLLQHGSYRWSTGKPEQYLSSPDCRLQQLSSRDPARLLHPERCRQQFYLFVR